MPVSLSPWYDPANTLEGVRDKLRLQIGDIDEDRLHALIPAAARLIDDELDRCTILNGPPPHPAIQFALEHVTIRLYLDTPTTPADGSTFVAGFADPLDDVRAVIRSFKQRWGIRVNRIAEARERITTALEVVLPGRVNAYPLTKIQRGLAPVAWLGSPSVDPETVGTMTNVWVAVFPLHLVVDGATHAQCALLDDLTAQTIDALEAARNLSARHVEPADEFVDNGHILRGVVVDVAATITARTFTIPTPTVAAVPPVPVPV